MRKSDWIQLKEREKKRERNTRGIEELTLCRLFYVLVVFAVILA